MPYNNQANVLQQLKAQFKEIGYTDPLVQEEYLYSDVLASENKTKTIPLAVFSQLPLSYKTASFGVIFSNGSSGPEFVQDYRSLGAPLIFEASDTDVTQWKVTPHDDPVRLETNSLDNLNELFQSNENKWNPSRVLSAKSDELRQLDFIDLGLMPALDHEVRKKISNLLEDSIGLAKQTLGQKFSKDEYPSMFRLVFRLIASKILLDREYPELGSVSNPESAIREAEKYCFGDRDPEPVLKDSKTQTEVWNHIRGAFHFQNLSVNALAYVYENTLVTDTTRRHLGIHSTPPEIAEYIVRNLPFEALKTGNRRVFEPFSGHSVFLMAAMQRLRDLLPPDTTHEERHDYLVRMLNGIETDSFAREVALLSLMLSDYPNSNGWNVQEGDAFNSRQFEVELEKADIVLCNPPFEEFSLEDKSRYLGLRSNSKAGEALSRVLQSPPKLLGFVMPRSFLSSESYRDLRNKLGRIYSSVELVALPDRIFQNSEVETVLLLSSGEYKGRIKLKTGTVTRNDLDDFYANKLRSSMDERTVKADQEFADIMWLPFVDEVWSQTVGMKKLADFIEIRTGIRYKEKYYKDESRIRSAEDKPGFKPGVHRVLESVEPYVTESTIYLNMDPGFMKTRTHLHSWDKPKLIVNAHRRSRGTWKMAASIDHRGLVFDRNFYGIWPMGELKLEVIAAILNGPVGNAFVHSFHSGRNIRITDLRRIPVPEFAVGQQETIALLVQRYIQSRELWLKRKRYSDKLHEQCLMLLKEIDAEILKAYHLEPRLERMLLDSFNEWKRLGPVEFREYYPSDFKPHIPWHIYISEEFEKSRTKYIRKLPLISESSIIDEALSYLD